MAQLSKIISSILRDMLTAQHEANLYAIALSESYQKNGRADKFPLPAIAMGEMELELKYGIKDASVQMEQHEIDYPELRRITREISDDLAQVIVHSVVSTLMDSTPKVRKKGFEKVELLSQEQDLHLKFSAFLSRKLFKTIQLDFGDNGILDNQEALVSKAVDVGEKYLIRHGELDDVFQQIGGEQVRQDAKENMQEAIEGIVPKLMKDANVMRTHVVPTIDVMVTADELERLPEECIHSIHFKVVPRNISLHTADLNDE